MHKRLAIFASYNAQGLITPDVIYYLKRLNEVVDGVIFVADNEISAAEEAKLNGLVVFKQFKRHGEYDFGSYKRGYVKAKETGLFENIDELILCNDSVYGPFKDFKEFFTQKDIDGSPDFYGFTKNLKGYIKTTQGKFQMKEVPHYQSFFVVLNKPLFNSDEFEKFIMSVEHKENKIDIIIDYEQGLSKLVYNNGFSHNSYIKSDYGFDLTIFQPYMLISEGFFLKKSLTKNSKTLDYFKLNSIIKDTDFPYYITSPFKLTLKSNVQRFFLFKLFIKSFFIALPQNLFSIKNENDKKVVKVLFFKIKFKRK